MVTSVWPLESLWNLRRRKNKSPILDGHGGPRRNPSVRRHAEEPAAVDHLAPRLWKRRYTELHAAGESGAVPGRGGAACVLLPDAQPRKVTSTPDVTERQLVAWRMRDEIPVLLFGIHQMGGIRARHRRRRGAPEVRASAANRRRHWPVEFGARDEIVRRAERALGGFRARRRSPELRNAPLDERRSERDVLRPA